MLYGPRSGGYRNQEASRSSAAQRRRGGRSAPARLGPVGSFVSHARASWCLRCGGRFTRSSENGRTGLLARIPDALGLQPVADRACQPRSGSDAAELERTVYRSLDLDWTHAAMTRVASWERRRKGAADSIREEPVLQAKLGSWISERLSYNESVRSAGMTSRAPLGRDRLTSVR